MRAVSLVLLVLGLAGCGGGDTPPADVDAGGIMLTDSGSGPACEVPGEPYGTSVGRTIEPFTLNQCDGTPYSFYGDDFCDTRLTVISIAAGWCGPCMAESAELTERVTERYRADGVRVIQIIVQNPDRTAPTPEFCRQWVDNFGLTNIEVIDPSGVTSPFFTTDALPETLMVDSRGVIVFREAGASAGLVSLTSKIEELLAAM